MKGSVQLSGDDDYAVTAEIAELSEQLFHFAAPEAEAIKSLALQGAIEVEKKADALVASVLLPSTALVA